MPHSTSNNQRTRRLSADGAELARLVASISRRVRILGIVGAPGAGKSSLAAAVVHLLGGRGARVPMDGFHLADVELSRQGLLGRKGAPETFDARGYAALLERLRARAPYTIYAPAFERELEQPLAGAIAIAPGVEVVVTEGNYLLVELPEWLAVAEKVDEIWYVEIDEELRHERLLARHVEFGKSPDEAAAWVARVDEPNARLIEETRSRADHVLDLTDWKVSS